ncbi:nicotinamide N-methyltransferase-like [Ambystoma mexicanum]|uniref:nicotinamide N-methyltransferase-like n=1 Tax=Ambystoma mexicanum TaxID=8296 RepID=UPI0037E802F1
MASRSARCMLFEKHYKAEHSLAAYHHEDAEFLEDSQLVLTELFRFFSSGDVKGDTLIYYGGCHALGYLFPACRFFKEIILAAFLETRLQAARTWINKEPGAFDWSLSAKIVCKLEGNREIGIEKEESLRRKITKFIKCEANEDHPVAPKLPTQADCVLSTFFLDFLCTDVDGFCKALKDMSSLLKIGGHLVLVLFLGCTFVMIGTFKMPFLCLDVEFVKAAVIDAGLVIKESKNNERVNQTKYSVMDYASVFCLVACKEDNGPHYTVGGKGLPEPVKYRYR